MKILMLNYEFPPLGGGAGNATFYLLKEFSKMKNISIDLVTSSARNRYEVEQFSENIRIYKLNVRKKDVHHWKMYEVSRWTWKAYVLSKNLIRENKYDLCHCWFGWPSGLIGYWFRKRLSYIVALRGSDVPGYNIRLKRLDRLFFKPLSKMVWGSAKAVIANSDGLRQLALRTLNSHIDVICNGVDVNAFTPSYRTHKKLRLICVSRLIERKGITYLFEALSHLKDVHLTIIGRGDKERELKSLVVRLKVQNKVKFIGYIPHDKLKKYYQGSDVFVLPSLNEGMSNTVLEAMASGLPLIVTDVGGTKELIKDNGYVVKKKSVADLINAVNKFVINRKVIIEMGMESRRLAEGLSWASVAEQYAEVYS